MLDAFEEENPDVTVKYTSGGNNLPTLLSTAVRGGNPPDIAMIAQPGLIRDFVEQGALKPIEFAREDIEANFPAAFVELGTVDGQLYGLPFKVANKSLGWYNVTAWQDAGVEPPATWEELLAGADTLKASGVPAYSIGGGDGWTLTDLFENIYLRTAGPEKYDQLANHEIPWTDPSVKDALREMAKVVGDSDNIAGGTRGALQTDFPTSVSNAFSDPPKAATVFEGDFVESAITSSTQAEPGTGYDVFDFPSINGSPPVVVGAGDIAVVFRDSPAAQALIRYLASPEAAQIRAEGGGFLSANRNVDPSVYGTETTQRIATALTNAETFRFDMSDLQPAAFGGTPGQGLWKELQDFMARPQDVDGTAQRIERLAARAFRSGK